MLKTWRLIVLCNLMLGKPLHKRTTLGLGYLWALLDEENFMYGVIIVEIQSPILQLHNSQTNLKIVRTRSMPSNFSCLGVLRSAGFG
jgi:hypothetical protein